MTDLLDNITSNITKIETICKTNFGLNIFVQKITIDSRLNSDSSRTTLFTNDNGDTFLLCMSDYPMTLANVKKIVKENGMQAIDILPPNADEKYFLNFGEKIFRSVFPSRKLSISSIKSYYQTLAPYNPALIKVHPLEAKVSQPDNLWQRWQKSFNFTYRKPQVR